MKKYLLYISSAVVMGACSALPLGRADVSLSSSPDSLEVEITQENGATKYSTAPATFEFLLKGPSAAVTITGYTIAAVNTNNVVVPEVNKTATVAKLDRVEEAKDVTTKVTLNPDLSPIAKAWTSARKPGGWQADIQFTYKDANGYTGQLTASGVPLVFNDKRQNLPPPPVVTLARPAAGSTLSGIVQVEARVESQAKIKQVALLVNGSLLPNPVTSAPYVFTLDTTQYENGSLRIQARATDEFDQTGTSTEQTYTLNNLIPPQLSITEPQDGDKISRSLSVVVSVLKKATDFTYKSPITVELFDYRGSSVGKRTITAPDNQDFVGRIDPPFDLSSNYRPNDSYDLEVRATVQLSGETSPRELTKRIRISTVTTSNLPPALVLLAPFRADNYDISTSPAKGVPQVGDFFVVVGNVTDDSGKVHAVETRLVCDGSIPSAEDDGCLNNPINALAGYQAGPYSLFTSKVFTNATPYVPNGLYVLRMVAVDAEDQNVRNTQELIIRVNRGDPVAEAARDQLRALPFTRAVTDSADSQVSPATGTWTLDLTGITDPVQVVFVVSKNGNVVETRQGIFKGTKASINFIFGDNDAGTWKVDVALQNTVNGAYVYREDGGSVTVSKKKSTP